VAILPLLGVGGMQLYRAETPGPMKDNKLTPRITETAKALWYLYLGLTILCALAYWLAGMTPFDAVAHSFSTVAIGGFSTHDASLGYFNNPLIELVAVFFMTVAGINFALLAQNPGLLIGLTLGLMALKGLVLFGLAHVFKLRGSDRWLLALGLAQAGEFGFVLIGFTVASAVIPDGVAAMLSLIVAMSMLLTPLLFILHDKLIAKHFSDEQTREADAMDEDKPVIIAGRGRIGGIVHRMVAAAGYDATVVDFSSKQLDDMRVFGIDKVFFGDATRPDLLHAAGIEHAKLLVVTLDGREDITRLVHYVTQTYPDVHILARAVDRHHVYELWEAGCRDIVRETYDSSIRMGRSAFEALGIARPTAQAMADEFEAVDRWSLREVADLFDSSVPATENEVYVAKLMEIMGQREPALYERMKQIRSEHAMSDVEPEPTDAKPRPAE